MLRRHFKRTAAFLILMSALIAVSAFLPASGAQALDYSALESGLNTWQYYFARTVMSLSLKDYYDTGVLPSITAGQAFFEGGCAGAPISIIAQNHFGIKAFPDWEGKVYDNNTHEVFGSYTDLVNIKGESYAKSASLWRAYDTWEEGVADHSNLLLTESKYSIVLNAKDYTEASYALREAGYCGEESYPSLLIGYIEQYGFDALDSVTADENGVFGLIMDRSRVVLTSGETAALTATAYPAPQTEIAITWNSTRPDVVSVDQNGNVTAHKQGFSLITATYNGKEACCVVCVDANGYVMNQNLYVYAEPGNYSTSVGRLMRGQPLRVNSETVYHSSDGTEYYAVSAGVGSGAPISGYAAAEHIYLDSEARLSLGTPKTVYYQSVGDTVTVPLEIYAQELEGKQITWVSSMPETVSVDENGTFSALAEGVAVISVQLEGKTALTVTVYVGEAAYDTLLANAAVYLRAGPTQGAKILGTILKGSEVKLISEPQNGWYLILAEIGGQTLQGYSYSRYFDRVEITPPDDSSDETSDESSPEDSSEETSGESLPEDSSEETSDESLPEDSSEETSDESLPEDSSEETSDETILVPYPAGKVNVDDALNVRDKAGMDGKKIARLLGGDIVIILEDLIYIDSEPTYKEWYHIRFTYEGAEREGYVCADFLLPAGTVEVQLPKPDLPTCDSYRVEELYISNIPQKTPVETFAQAFTMEIRVFRTKNGVTTELTAQDIVATGDEIHFCVRGVTVYTRTAVVKGDASGDGEVDAKDYMMTKRVVIGTYSLEGAYLRAAAVDDETVNARDYMMIKRVALGTYAFQF